MSLGDSTAQVRYALGQPTEFLLWDTDPKGEFAEFPEVVKFGSPEKGHLIGTSKGWLYSQSAGNRLVIDFDKAGGVVTEVSCYSDSSVPLLVFGTV